MHGLQSPRPSPKPRPSFQTRQTTSRRFNFPRFSLSVSSLPRPRFKSARSLRRWGVLVQPLSPQRQELRSTSPTCCCDLRSEAQWRGLWVRPVRKIALCRWLNPWKEALNYGIVVLTVRRCVVHQTPVSPFTSMLLKVWECYPIMIYNFINYIWSLHYSLGKL
jgi:hypothetical protein